MEKKQSGGIRAFNVRAEPELMDKWEETMRSYGYVKVAPFLRRLLAAAEVGDRRTGQICFFDGRDDGRPCT